MYVCMYACMYARMYVCTYVLATYRKAYVGVSGKNKNIRNLVLSKYTFLPEKCICRYYNNNNRLALIIF